jgi:uncharacterized protein (DUF2141 family)
MDSMKGRLTLAAALLALLFATAAIDASEKLTLRVTPTVSSAPGTVTVRAYVERDAENRRLRIEADSGSFYRSSEVQLDGATAPTLTEFLLISLPSGEYSVIGTLEDATGKQTVVRRTAIVVSRGAEP